MPTLMLLDSASMYFRAFYGVKNPPTAADGTQAGAVRGFLDAVAHLLVTRRPTHLVACWDDDWRPAFRVEAIGSYKAHRVAAPAAGGVAVPDGAAASAEAVPDALTPQVPIIVDVLAAVGIARLGAPGCEADDVIGTLATRAVAGAQVDAVEIVTGDRDLFQLVSDGPVPVRVLYTAKGMRNLEIVDPARLAEKYGVASGDAYADLAALRGDPSDGLPGVAGIGEKTAAGLLARFGSLEGVLAAVDAADPRLSAAHAARLRAAAGYLAVAPSVVRVLRDAALPAVAVPTWTDALPSAPVAPEALAALTDAWPISSPVARLVAALATVSTP